MFSKPIALIFGVAALAGNVAAQGGISTTQPIGDVAPFDGNGDFLFPDDGAVGGDDQVLNMLEENLGQPLQPSGFDADLMYASGGFDQAQGGHQGGGYQQDQGGYQQMDQQYSQKGGQGSYKSKGQVCVCVCVCVLVVY
jgi:hypothetical protein